KNRQRERRNLRFSKEAVGRHYRRLRSGQAQIPRRTGPWVVKHAMPTSTGSQGWRRAGFDGKPTRLRVAAPRWLLGLACFSLGWGEQYLSFGPHLRLRSGAPSIIDERFDSPAL